jgi:hypothetical protein
VSEVNNWTILAEKRAEELARISQTNKGMKRGDLARGRQ